MPIDRVGTAANAQLLLAQIQKAEAAVDSANRQVVSGKVSTTYSGYGDKTAIMEAARSASARSDANAAAAQQASVRLDLQDTQLSELSDLAGEVRQTLTKAAADQDATSLMSQMQGFYNQAVEILNSKDANGYIYGGDNNQTPPVTVTDLTALAALPSVANAFANGQIKTNVRVGDSQTVQVGLLASDLGTQLFSLFQQVAQFDAGAGGPFDSKTTPAQQNFIESMIQPATTVAEGVNGQAAANGIRYQMVEDTMTQLQARSTVYSGFVSSLQDVDMAEALTRLNQSNTALQAAFQVTSTLNKLSLLDFMQ
jgi:flagellar hook-associated protein 3 FlgL